MAGCVLRVREDGFDAARFLAAVGWEGATTFGDGFNLTISEADDAAEQVEDAIAFLQKAAAELSELQASIPGAPVLDFGCFITSDSVAATVRIPVPLVDLAAANGIGIEVSVYASDA